MFNLYSRLSVCINTRANMKKTTHKILSTIVVIPLIGLVFIFGQIPLMEGYNVFAPYIDTEFAEDYSPELFDEITSDLSMKDVISIVGEPLFIHQDTINGQIEIKYIYTNDGCFGRNEKSNRFTIGDFAWYRSVITFNKQGEITHIDKGWCYD